MPVRTTQVSETGTTQSVEFIPEGVDLKVTPVVSPGSKQISLVVSVSVSELKEKPLSCLSSCKEETPKSANTATIGLSSTVGNTVAKLTL